MLNVKVFDWRENQHSIIHSMNQSVGDNLFISSSSQKYLTQYSICVFNNIIEKVREIFSQKNIYTKNSSCHYWIPLLASSVVAACHMFLFSLQTIWYLTTQFDYLRSNRVISLSSLLFLLLLVFTHITVVEIAWASENYDARDRQLFAIGLLCLSM
jgi:hypothetical protein